MDVTTARKRLADMLSELDRSIGVLRGDPVSVRDRSAADAGSDLTDTDRAGPCWTWRRPAAQGRAGRAQAA